MDIKVGREICIGGRTYRITSIRSETLDLEGSSLPGFQVKLSAVRTVTVDTPPLWERIKYVFQPKLIKFIFNVDTEAKEV